MFYFAAPLAILSSVLQDFDPGIPVTFAYWLIASSIGFYMMILVATGSREILKLKYLTLPVKSILFMLLAFITGASKGLFTGLVGGVLADTSGFNNALLPRTMTSGLIALFLIPTGSILLSIRERFNTERQYLIRELIRIEIKTNANHDTISNLNNLADLNSENGIARNVKELLQEVSNLKDMPAESQWEYISAGLKRIVNEDIRPLSKSLWKSRINSYPELSIKELIALSVNEFIFPMWFVVGACAVGTAGQALRHSNGESILTTLIWQSAGIVLPYLVLRPLVKKKLLNGKIGLLLMTAIAVVIESIRFNQNKVDTFSLTTNLNSAIFALFLVATLLSGGVISAALKSQAKLIEELNSNLDKDRIKLLSMEILGESANRDLAKYLHGQLQTRLMSMALSLDLASKTANEEKAKTAIDEIELVLANSIPRTFTRKYESVQECISKVSQAWSGLVKIDSQISGDFTSISEGTLTNIGLIAEEGIANAARHGMAESIKVLIEAKSANLYRIEISDDGLGFEKLKPGLGSDLLTSICGKNWSLVNQPGRQGAILTAQISTN